MSKDLLATRFKIIGKWPDMGTHKVGDVITLPSDEWKYATFSVTHCEEDYFLDFPNCFRKMEWWEDRDKKDMPEYLISINRKTVGKVSRWKISKGGNDTGTYAEVGNRCWFVTGCLPSTEEEYNQQKA